MQLRIERTCEWCGGVANESSTKACSNCFGKGKIVLVIPGVINYEEFEDNETIYTDYY